MYTYFHCLIRSAFLLIFSFVLKNVLMIRSDAFNLKIKSFRFAWSLQTSLAGLFACYYKEQREVPRLQPPSFHLKLDIFALLTCTCLVFVFISVAFFSNRAHSAGCCSRMFSIELGNSIIEGKITEC